MKVYVDMDGVIADFFTELADHYGVTHWKNLPDKDASVKALKGTDFFGRLPKFDTSDELIDYVDHLTAGDWSILSSPLRDDHDNSGFWKRQDLRIFQGRRGHVSGLTMTGIFVRHLFDSPRFTLAQLQSKTNS